MNHEANRLRTFRNWPTAAEVDRIRLAQCGFFYLGVGVEVQCFSCGGKISEWNYDDQIMVRHRQLDPQCQFVLNPASSGNVPIGQSAASLLSEFSGGDRNAEMASRDDIYKNDALRLLSYVHWPSTSPPREEMVLAGFYHLTGERVRCAWCGLEVHRNWSEGDDPFEEHKQLFPQCPYVWQRDLAPASQPVSSADIMTNNDTITVMPMTVANQNPLINRDLSNLNTNVLEAQEVWESLGVVPVGSRNRSASGATTLQGPRNPSFASIASRLVTFRDWPSSAPLTPTDLAHAGFFFTGTADQVRCFYCDGGLGRWEPGDNPWSEHKRWFPRCPFLNLARPDPVIRRSPHRDDSSNASADDLISYRSSGSCLPVPEHQVPSVNSIIVSRSLGETVFHDWDWESPNCRQLHFLVGQNNKSGIQNSGAPESQTSTSQIHNNSRIAPSGDDRTVPQHLASTTNLEIIVKALQEENRQLKEAKLCKVCMDDEVSTVFLPCGHAAGCGGCAPGLTHCPLCRADVHALIRAYLP